MSQFVLLFLFFCSFRSSFQLIDNDIVSSIPDYIYRGKLFSGYLEVDSVKRFHYMLNYAHQDPDNKPLVLWLNGGPGCSSLDGWAYENGPMQMDENGKFQINEYSWNRAANMLYLESPGDVGYSYIDSYLDYELAVSDDIVAQDNLKALQDFFKKFPSFKGRDFYIAGESYAGIYIPMLAYNIINYNRVVPMSQKINLKGILVGNGVADPKYDDYKAMIDFGFSHHLYSYEIRMDFNKYCEVEFNSTKCNNVFDKIDKLLDGVNVYDYTRECELPTKKNGEIDYESSYYKRARWAFRNLEQKKQSKTMRTKLKKKSLNSSIPCINDEFITEYLNRDDVKSALHIDINRKWELCSDIVYDRYEQQRKGSIWAYPYIIKEGIRILVYNGDTDLVVPFNGNQAWINDLGLEIENPWHQWRVNDDDDYVGGYFVRYKGLAFCTIKGVGHMTPQWKPRESFYMFEQFLKGKDL